MKLRLTRQVFTDKSTIGTLAVDGVVACQTLEDRVRRDDPTTVADEGRKVPGSTAIPAGRSSASTPATTIATPRGASWSAVRVAGT